MSGVEVLGVISGVIGIVDNSIKIYDSVKRDKKLPETFKIVRSRMPFILDTLQICANKLRPNQDSIPTDICDALEDIVSACDKKAEKLQKVFKNAIPTENDFSWERYLKVVRRWGKGKQVEELMEALTKDVQLLVNHNAVSSATLEQNDQLENIVEEMQSLRNSVAEEQHQPLRFESGGGPQTNNVNSGSGQQINNNGQVGAQNFYSVNVRSSEYENEESTWDSDASDESAVSYHSPPRCYNCRKRGHIQYYCPYKRPCNRCGDWDHDADDCTWRDDDCYRCGLPGHYSRDCYVRL